MAFKEKQADDDFSVAADALTELKQKDFDLKKLKLKPQLQALLRVLKCGKGNEAKPDAINALMETFGNISKDEFAQLEARVQRGVVQATLPSPLQPLGLPEPAPAAAAAPTAATVDTPQPQALTRPRRG
eukprot:2106975-Prymnesium_polylepis.1